MSDVKVKEGNSDCMKPCSGLVITSFTESKLNKNLDNMPSTISDYESYKKVTEFPAGYYGNEHSFWVPLLIVWLFQIINGKAIWDMWGFSSRLLHLTESLKTGQPSSWTCCQQLEAPWDFSLGSPSSVEWRLSTLLLN